MSPSTNLVRTIESNLCRQFQIFWNRFEWTECTELHRFDQLLIISSADSLSARFKLVLNLKSRAISSNARLNWWNLRTSEAHTRYRHTLSSSSARFTWTAAFSDFRRRLLRRPATNDCLRFASARHSQWTSHCVIHSDEFRMNCWSTIENSFSKFSWFHLIACCNSQGISLCSFSHSDWPLDFSDCVLVQC